MPFSEPKNQLYTSLLGVHVGSIFTGAEAAGVSDMTGGAAAVIPEVLHGQVLSLARRGGVHTVLAAGTGDVARDRLVVLLQPIAEEEKGSEEGRERWGKHKSRDGEDERPKHALVISCLPGQVNPAWRDMERSYT